jgi:uncharacterized protein YuzE
MDGTNSTRRKPVRFTHDPQADAVSIHLVDSIQPGGVARSHVCDIELPDRSIVLDFDIEDKLVGIEILGASRLLPEQMLKDPV